MSSTPTFRTDFDSAVVAEVALLVAPSTGHRTQVLPGPCAAVTTLLAVLITRPLYTKTSFAFAAPTAPAALDFVDECVRILPPPGLLQRLVSVACRMEDLLAVVVARHAGIPYFECVMASLGRSFEKRRMCGVRNDFHTSVAELLTHIFEIKRTFRRRYRSPQ